MIASDVREGFGMVFRKAYHWMKAFIILSAGLAGEVLPSFCIHDDTA
jgi:hypothetical protein